MQYYNLKNYILYTQGKGQYIQYKVYYYKRILKTMTAKCYDITGNCGTIESSERGRDRSYVITSKTV